MVAVDIIATSPLHELPVGILPGDLVVLELEQVAAADLEPLPWVVVPVSSHSEQPRSPLTQWRSSP
jgi:hypothetical protein